MDAVSYWEYTVGIRKGLGIRDIQIYIIYITYKVLGINLGRGDWLDTREREEKIKKINVSLVYIAKGTYDPSTKC